MKTIIRAAVESGRPPLELLLDEPGRKRCRWDGKLIKAYFLEKDFDLEGHPIWIEESPDIVFQAKRRRIRSLAAVEAAQDTHGKKKNPEKGVRFFAEATVKPGRPWPTRAGWMERRASVPEQVDVGDEKAVARASAAEARAAEKIANNPDALRIIADIEARVKGRSDRLDG